jgi:hypothetical protein
VSSEDGNNAQFKYWQRWKKACTLLKWNFIWLEEKKNEIYFVEMPSVLGYYDYCRCYF